MRPFLLIVAALALVALNGFFVAAEFALVKVRSSEVETLLRRRVAGAAAVKRALKRLDAMLSASQVGITLASLGLGWIGEPAIADLIRPLFMAAGIGTAVAVHSVAATIAFLLITFLHVVLGEQVPKYIAIVHPVRASLAIAVPLAAFNTITWPFIWVLNSAANLVLRLLGIPGVRGHERAHTEEELRLLVAASRESGLMDADHARTLRAVLELGEKSTRQIMVPRPDVVYLDVRHPLPENLAIVDASGHTRYPVCDGDLDHVVGLLNVKDLYARRGECGLDLPALLRPPMLVPDTLSAEKLLREFQRSRRHLAAVVDEHGGVCGIVTMEDVLEEVVGEIQDEFDEEEPRVRGAGEGEWLVDGVTPLPDLSRALGWTFEDPLNDTIAGAVQGLLGRLARPGDEVIFGPFRFCVEQLQNRRIARLRAQRMPSDVTAEPGKGR